MKSISDDMLEHNELFKIHEHPSDVCIHGHLMCLSELKELNSLSLTFGIKIYFEVTINDILNFLYRTSNVSQSNVIVYIQ